MTHVGLHSTVKFAVSELRTLRSNGGDWTEAEIKLLRRAVNILVDQGSGFPDHNTINDRLRKAKTLARASYVDMHSHSHFCYTGTTRGAIIFYSQNPDSGDHYKIACLLREYFSPVGNMLDSADFLAWKQGLSHIGHRGKLLEAMKKGSHTRSLLEEIHEEVEDFLKWTKPLDRYLLH